MQNKEKTLPCKLVDKIKITNNVVTLRFKPENGKRFEFKSGQYVLVNVSDPGPNGVTGKMYTISSAPGIETFDVTVKKMGSFSGRLHELKIGDSISVAGPYGELFPKDVLRQVVFISGGIGVTPFYSLIQGYEKGKNKRPKSVVLLSSNRTLAEAAFIKEINDVADKWGDLKTVNTFTREKVKNGIGENGRIDEKFIKKHVKNLADSDYYICGSIDFSDSIWRMLGNLGVSEGQIFIETFY